MSGMEVEREDEHEIIGCAWVRVDGCVSVCGVCVCVIDRHLWKAIVLLRFFLSFISMCFGLFCFVLFCFDLI